MKNKYSIIAFIILLGNITFIAYSLPNLPDIIPTHFNGKGEIDGWGNKYTLIIPAVIQTLINLVLHFLSMHPEKHNYLRPITDENRALMYKASSELIGRLNIAVSLIFTTITYSIVCQQLPMMIILFELACLIALLVHHLIITSRK